MVTWGDKAEMGSTPNAEPFPASVKARIGVTWGFTYHGNSLSEDCTASSPFAPLHDGFAAGLKGRTGVTWGSQVYCRNFNAAFRGDEKICSTEFSCGAVLKEVDDWTLKDESVVTSVISTQVVSAIR